MTTTSTSSPAAAEREGVGEGRVGGRAVQIEDGRGERCLRVCTTLGFLLEAACDETSEKSERAFIQLLLTSASGNDNEVLKQSAVDYISGYVSASQVKGLASPVLLSGGLYVIGAVSSTAAGQ